MPQALKPLLHSIRVRGWRSFDSASGLALDGLAPINVLIGPNNVGKSNVGKFLVWLRNSIPAATDDPWTPNTAANQPVDARIEEQDYFRHVRTPFECRLQLAAADASDQLGAHAAHFLKHGVATVLVRVVPYGDRARLSLLPLSVDDEPLFDEAGNVWLAPGKHGDFVPDSHRHGMFGLALKRKLVESIIDVHALRDYARRRQTLHASSFDGGGLVHELEASRLGARPRWQALREDLQRWIGRLLGEQTPPTMDVSNDGVRLTFNTGARLQLNLEDLGTGVAEVVMLLAFLRLRRGEQVLAVIDEPEAHLHPAAAVELMRILSEEMSGTQIIATTHSTAIIDSMNERWKVFKVSMDDTGGTRIIPLDTRREQIKLARELGVTATQLFLARTVVWVEGPSDAVYLRRLLREANPVLLEGRDYGFAIYGGSLMSHLTFDPDDTEHIVRLLHLAPNPIVVADRDSEPGTSVRKALTRLQESGGADRVWHTPGREIENTVRADALREAIRACLPTVEAPDGRRVLVELPEDFWVAEGEAFDVVAADRVVSTIHLEAAHRDRIRRALSDRKLRLSEVVCARDGHVFTDTSLDWAKGLATQIENSR